MHNPAWCSATFYVDSRSASLGHFTLIAFRSKIASLQGRLAQRIERLLHTQEVTGSNPVLPTITIILFATHYVPPPSLDGLAGNLKAG
jgi:hypothetical protein